jgi:hypothetical protein
LLIPRERRKGLQYVISVPQANCRPTREHVSRKSWMGSEAEVGRIMGWPVQVAMVVAAAWEGREEMGGMRIGVAWRRAVYVRIAGGGDLVRRNRKAECSVFSAEGMYGVRGDTTW